MDQPINVEVDWRYVSGVLVILGLAIIGYFRDRARNNERFVDLEEHKKKCDEERKLLRIEIPSDPMKWVADVERLQAAAKANGKVLDAGDLLIYLRHRAERREAKKEEHRRGD